jgi:hypothetical protein
MIVLVGQSKTIIQASAPDLPIEKGRPCAGLYSVSAPTLSRIVATHRASLVDKI